MVSRGSRACGVTPRTPPRGSAPDHLGSPPITTDHHHFVGGWVGKGDRGCGGGTTGGPRGGEPGVPGVRGHAQVPPERFRARSPRLTTYHHRSPRICGCVVGKGDGGVEGRPQGVPAVVSRGSRASGVTPRSPPRGSAPDHLGSPPITTDHHGTRRRDASATKVPAAPAFPAVVVTAASATASETNSRLRSIQRPTSTCGIQI